MCSSDLDRLTAADLTKRAGAITALVIILIVVVAIVINQVRIIRKTGWLPHYLAWYILGGLVMLVIALLPGFQFRLHHYIIAMVLMPGTSFPTRLSAIYQSFLLGLFLNGVAAFGFDPILQTAADVGLKTIIFTGDRLTCVYVSYNAMGHRGPSFHLS